MTLKALRREVVFAVSRFLNHPMVIKIKNVLKYILIIPFLFELIGRLKYRTQKKVWGIVFLIPWILGFLLFFLVPFFRSFYFSFHKISTGAEGLQLERVGLQNYLDAFLKFSLNDITFQEYLLSSLWNLIIDIPVIIIFSLLMAVILNGKFRGRTFARAVFFIPVILNSRAVQTAITEGEAVRIALEQAGLTLEGIFDFERFLFEANFAQGLVTFLTASVARIYDIITRSGVQILLFLAAIQSVPGHLYEAAKIEGATQYEMFWKITLPVVSPMIIPATIYTVVDSYLSMSVSDVISYVFFDQKYGLSAAMSYIYFASVSILLAFILFLISRVVFYYDK